MPNIEVQNTSDRIVEIVLNRPERRNALTGPLADELAATLRSVASSPETTVVVLRGAGGAFCSGLDLKEFGADPTPAWVPDFGRSWRAVHEAIYDLPVILIGALERAAVNGGASLALACDLLVAGETSFLQVGEIQQGMAAPMNTAWLRLRHSEAVTARVELIGDRIAGPELLDLGLAHQVVPDDQTLTAARALADRLAGHDPEGVRRIKTALRQTGLAEDGASWFDRVQAASGSSGAVRPRAAERV